ncbi:hypothetical protein B0H17DRAFT_616644 [Mycena rosella]|uniref:Uncharacterized protein n=1 Tax=Mycena rosella TaxID=1033263 RepID=A0AAD7GVC8_MYCRO|nr:hypothetical protein B0H17DRAFT_616644 [Mycena rosella]
MLKDRGQIVESKKEGLKYTLRLPSRRRVHRMAQSQKEGGGRREQRSDREIRCGWVLCAGLSCRIRNFYTLSATMILPAYKQQQPSQEELLPAASSSAPPPFQDEPPLIDFSDAIPGPGGEEPPPVFTPYEAECFNTGSGNIVSHDQHLNSDGEALYRFLLSQSTDSAPIFRLHCRGTHTETRYRHVTSRSSDGRTRTRRESYTETVVDFDFYIDASHFTGPVHWSVGDSEPAYRGGMVREVESPDGKRKATRAEVKLFKGWLEDRTARGLPPWITSIDAWSEGLSANATVLKSSRTLRQWADEYCASPKHLKEFTYEKVVYGWNIRQLENAIRATILAAPYSGNVSVDFSTSASTIYIRPDNRLSRMLSNKWLKFLSILLLIFPFIWLFKRFHSRGGGSWSVCGGAYALKSWVPVVEPEAQDISTFKGQPPPPPAEGRSLITTADGTSRLSGMREGEWFRKWQPTIVRAVCNRYQSSTPLFTTTEEPVPFARGLDGY